MDLEQPDAALVFLSRLRPSTAEEKARVESLRSDVLEALGRDDEARVARETSRRLFESLDGPIEETIFTDLEDGAL